MWLSLRQIILLLCAGQFLVEAQATQWPLHDDGLNKVVQWDHYSLQLRGQRILIWSGEFHYWRIPVPNMWKDLMHKIKAAGFNTFSIYVHWAYHNPSFGNLNFEGGGHDIEPIFEYAKEIGLWVIVRPGPYINAETNAGGFPAWVTTGAYGRLRDNDTRYTEAWTPYFAKISSIVSKHTVVKGGNVLLYQIENEFSSEFTDPVKKTPYYPSIDYMETLEKVARDNGIDIPTMTNAPGEYGKSWSKDYSNYGGEQDIYGLDSYPQCWSRNKTTCSQYGVYSTFTVQNYQDHFSLVSPTQPSFFPEFQGGNYNPWAYPDGRDPDSDVNFVNVFYRGNIGQRVTMHSLYMIYGGTNWGGLSFPDVASSYDYSAPIYEGRQIGSKYSETKLIGLQLRVLRDLTKCDWVGNTSYADNPVIYAAQIRNPDTNAGFYTIRHEPSNLTSTDDYKLNVNTSLGAFTIPQSYPSMQLIGQESKILTTDFSLTNGRSLIYSTAEILQFSTIEAESPLLVLWVPTGGQGEILLKGVRGGKAVRGTATIAASTHSTKLVSFQQSANSSTFVQFEDGLRVLTVDRGTAYTLWAPSLSNDPFTPESQTIVIVGPSLVRSASVQGSTITISGDAETQTSIEVFGPSSAKSIVWNGRPLSTKRTSCNSLTGSIPAPSTSSITVGPFATWKVADGLPERLTSYKDSAWIKADRMNTSSFYAPETFPVLYAEEYGIQTGPLLWRGHFSVPSSPSNQPNAVYLAVIGGQSFGYSTYLNGDLLGSWSGGTQISSANITFSFANVTLATDNVLLVVQDHSGKDETEGTIIPRGIINATLIGNNSSDFKFSSWRLGGPAGSATGNLLDHIRGPLNEGGTHAERLGWHLPGFNDGSWAAASVSSSAGTQTLSMASSGISFFRTSLPLSIPLGLDGYIAFTIHDPGTKVNFRVEIFVNGYQYGKFYSAIGPGHQEIFPVPPGVLNFRGGNTVAVSLWALDAGGAEVEVGVEVLGAVASGFDPMDGTEALRPAWTAERETYY